MSERSSPVRQLSVERPRKRGRPLSDEEKWLVYQVFEALAHARAETAVVGTLDSYSRTSKYTGVARSRVAHIAKSVRATGTVPPASAAGNRKPKPTAIPASAEGRIRAVIFERHRQGAVCSAMHVGALFKERVWNGSARANGAAASPTDGLWWVTDSAPTAVGARKGRGASAAA